MAHKVKRYFNAILEEKVVEALKIAAVKRGKSGSEIIQALLEEDLKKEIEAAIAS
jgi:hypothetical protein